MSELSTDDLLRIIANGTAGDTGKPFFQSLVRYMAQALNMRYAFIAEFADCKTHVRTLAFWDGNRFLDNFEYGLHGTPCEAVLAGETRCYPKNVDKLFPLDTGLNRLKAASYLAVPLIDSKGSVMGHLAVLDTKPMVTMPQDMTVFSIFTARACAELERLQAETELQKAHDELELRVQLRTAELAQANEALQTEINQRKRYEEKLLLRERAIEASSAGIIITDATEKDNPIIYANPAFTQMTGYKLEELIGLNPRILQGPETDSKAIEEIRSAVREARSCLVTLSNYHKDGSRFWNELFISPVRDRQGNLTHFIGVQTDVTQLLRAEEARRDMEIAKQIQLSLLPSSPLQATTALIEGLCLPATHVGGDYFDYFSGSDDIHIVIADVSGHSVGAALVMAEMRSTLKAEALRATKAQPEVGMGAGDILGLLNGILYDDLNRADLFISMFYMKYNQVTRELRFANAGHNRPIYLPVGDTFFKELDAEGIILGVTKEITFEEKSIFMQPGDLVLLYTDGIIEAENPSGEFFGTDRLIQIFANQTNFTPHEIINKIIIDLKAFHGSSSFADDVSMVVLKIT